jgi:phosphoribosyl-AMP cyclohydrolase
MTTVLDQIRFDKNSDGLVPAVVQDAVTKDVLMLGFMNRDAVAMTVKTGRVTFWQRSKQKLWTKGETSGNVLEFVALRVNCNADSLLVLANPVGATCHTGHPTCYFREANDMEGEWRTITEQQFDPDAVYGKSAPSADRSIAANDASTN